MSVRPVADVLGADWLAVRVSGFDVVRAELTATQLGPVSIRRGRSDPGRRFDPGTCTFTTTADAWPLGLPELFDRIDVELSAAAAAQLATGWPAGTADELRVRFRGTVTDVTERLHPDPARTVVEVTATSPLATLRRTVVNSSSLGGGSYPQQLDVDRAYQLVVDALAMGGASNAGGKLGLFEPGVVTVAAVTPLPIGEAGRLLDELSAQTRSELAERRDGTLDWHNANHRVVTAGTTGRTVLELDAQLVGSQVSLSYDGMANEARVTWGNPAAGTVIARHYDSQAAHGLWAVDTTAPLLTSAAAATALAEHLVAVQGLPRRQLDAVTVDVLASVHTPAPAGSWSSAAGSWSSAAGSWGSRAGGLLAADVDEPLSVDATRVTGAAPGLQLLWLEGYSESLSRTAWRLALTTSQPVPNRPTL